MADSNGDGNKDEYTEKLIQAVTNDLQLNNNASLLCLGGGDWEFGKRIANKLNALHYIYADDDQEELTKADQSDILTTYCQLQDTEQISSVGKYDAIIMKNSLEKILPTISSLESFFVALYKALKLNGNAIIIIRSKPTVPLPDNAANDWKEKFPEVNIIIKEAEEFGFECSRSEFNEEITIEKEKWRQELEKRRLPFMAETTDEDIDNCLQDYAETFTCPDDMEILHLTKVIT